MPDSRKRERERTRISFSKSEKRRTSRNPTNLSFELRKSRFFDDVREKRLQFEKKNRKKCTRLHYRIEKTSLHRERDAKRIGMCMIIKF